jgi:hypothetical protein
VRRDDWLDRAVRTPSSFGAFKENKIYYIYTTGICLSRKLAYGKVWGMYGAVSMIYM